MSYCNATICLNKEKPLFHSLLTFLYVTVPVYRSGSRLHAWSFACVSPMLIQGSKFFVLFCFLSGERRLLVIYIRVKLLHNIDVPCSPGARTGLNKNSVLLCFVIIMYIHAYPLMLQLDSRMRLPCINIGIWPPILHSPLLRKSMIMIPMILDEKCAIC